MKTPNQNQTSEVGGRNEQTYGINYTWADAKGRMHLGRSVGTGRDRAHAERRFFNQHRHVMREAGVCNIVPSLFLTFVLLLLVITLLAFQLAQRNAEVTRLKATLESAYSGQELLIHNLQAGRALSDDNGGYTSNQIFGTNGGAQ